MIKNLIHPLISALWASTSGAESVFDGAVGARLRPFGPCVRAKARARSSGLATPTPPAPQTVTCSDFVFNGIGYPPIREKRIFSQVRSLSARFRDLSTNESSIRMVPGLARWFE